METIETLLNGSPTMLRIIREHTLLINDIILSIFLNYSSAFFVILTLNWAMLLLNTAFCFAPDF